jgi:ATP-dependent exoDNAse (exonuclease V) beta subunit
MSFKRNREHWRSLYVHGVLPQHLFVRTGSGVPAAVRGTVIHEVLEHIEDEAQLAELLDVAVGSLDSPELEQRLARGTAEREAIEAEIQKVVSSPEWRWYVEGPHWRELSFVQFRHPRKWYVGAFDLYRPGEPTGLIVDFKTQTLKGSAEAEARKYRLQALVYRAVARRLGCQADVRFHFTNSGQIVHS